MAWKNVQYENGKYKTSEGGGGGGSSTFAGLDDVSFSDLQNGQVPKYNSDTHKWENADESGGGGTVTDVEVDGVSVVNPQTGVAEIELPTPPTIPVEDVEVNGESVVNAQKVAEIKSYKEVTQAQYEALPDSKLNDGILYAIKDGGQAVDGFPPLIYSDEEREIGVWRDGKPLYQKSYHFQGVLNQDVLIDSTITQTDNELVNVFGSWAIGNYHYANSSQASIFETIKFLNNTTQHPIVFVNSSGLYYNSNQNSYGFNMYLTVQYTKTTDTPGSGTWTTQGTLAHHYSTDEHIIGTWIDGKPLYEKTYTTPQFSNTGYDIETDIPFAIAFVYTGCYLLNDANGSMIGLNEWFANENRSFCHVEKNTKKIRCYLFGYTGIGYITIRYTKTTD